MVFSVLGTVLIAVGLVVSIVFWIDSVFDRARIKELTGNRYPLVYFIYIANGPLLIVFGLLLIVWSRL